MSESRNQESSSQRRSFLFVGLFIILIFLLLAAAYGGYQLGKSDAETPLVSAPLATKALETKPGSTAPPPEVTRTSVPDTAQQSQAGEKIVPRDNVPETTPTAFPTAETLKPTAESSDYNYEDLDLGTFYEVWRLIEEEFDGALPEDRDVLYSAISGSLEALDDNYTRFIRPEIAERLRDDLDGSVSGIGAIVRPSDDGLIQIVRPIDGQPAERAGLMPGDLIYAVDGETVAGLGFDEVLLLIRGPEGTTVILTILREGSEEPLDFSLVRAEFEVPVVEKEVYEQDGQTIAYVRLSSFTRQAEEELVTTLDELLSQNPDGLILDLRDNGGGFLDQAVAVADLFLPEGIVLFERSSDGELNETFRSVSGDMAEDIPLVVLVNSGSASASEIVAGAIKDNGRGILIGETTFGKGFVQHVHTLSDGSELRVTIARWFTPNDVSISEVGVSPDIEEPAPNDIGGVDDSQLQRAIDYISTGN